MKGKINIYDNQGRMIHSIQSLITITHKEGYVIIEYQDDNNMTRTLQTNMNYIYWQD
jgi:hypothetical protein